MQFPTVTTLDFPVARATSLESTGAVNTRYLTAVMAVKIMRNDMRAFP